MLIYVPKITNRLGYTLHVVFGSILRMKYEITTNAELFQQHEGGRLCYNSRRIDEDSVWIKSTDLLFHTTIDTQEPRCFEYEGLCAMFPVYGKNLDFPFDILAATFYLVSRYEEYLPHHCDEHGRFLASESIALQQGFLPTPIVERWALTLAHKIKDRFPIEALPTRGFDMTNTVDIDSAYCYKNKGVFRSITGFCRDLFDHRDMEEVRQRFSVLTKRREDPFDTFEYIIGLKDSHPDIHLVFFALLADYGMNDKNISHYNNDFQQLLKRLSDHAKVGIHASYASYDEPKRVEIETNRLKGIIHRNIVRNRSHFLRLRLPFTYRTLIDCNIRHDYTMGYAEEPGFRASISTPYPFYDLESDSETTLLIHPFAVMDTTLKKYKGQNPDEAWDTVKALMDEVTAVGGTFSCIFHNQNLSEDFGWEGWRTLYERTLDYGQKIKTESKSPENH